MGSNPIERFLAILGRAEKSGLDPPNAAALATVAEDGQPSVRMVLLKGADEDGFVFYTNLESRKSGELARNPRAALCFWWPELAEQVRVEGAVEQVSDDEADAYFATRDRGSQIGAWASKQSRELPSRADLEKAVEETAEKYGRESVPRPPHWSGFRVKPERIEFWKGKQHRLHERDLYVREASDWVLVQLYP